MEGQEVEQTLHQLESVSERQEQQQQHVVEKQEEKESESLIEPETGKHEQLEREPEKCLDLEPEKVLESDCPELTDLESVKPPEAVNQPEYGNLVEPEPEDDVEPEPEDDVEPEPVKQLQPEPEPMKQPEPEPEPVKQPEPEPVPVKQPEPEPEPVKQPEPEPEPVKQPEPEPEPVKQPEPEPEPVKQPAPKPEPVKQPAPKPEPVKQPEPKPEPVKQPAAEPEPVKQPAAEPEPVKQPEPKPEPVKQPAAEPEPMKQPEPKPEPVKQPAAEPEPMKQSEPKLEKRMESEPLKQLEPELEKLVQLEPQQIPEVNKHTETEKLEPEAPEKQPNVEAENKPETEEQLETESVKKPEESEKQEQEAQEEQQQAAAVDTPGPIVPGSLAFAFLEEEHTETALRTSRTLIILRGLPGSGKSRLADAIHDRFQGLCAVVSADDHNVKPENQASSVEGHKALDEAVAASCTTGTAVVVVDDTNHTHGRLARLCELAEQHQYYTLFLEPRTEWSHDVEQLVQKSQRGLDKSQIQALKGPLEETSLPLFFGWFLCPDFQDKLRSMARDFLKTLKGLETFKNHLSDFTGEAEKEMDLEQYFQGKGVLHCTTMFCDYGKAEGAKEYAEQQCVRDRYGSISEVEVSALFVTPRTLGAKVSLTEEQLQLWPAGAEKEAAPSADLPLGSRAHVTLGCAEGVEPAQTGLDLLEIVQQQKKGEEGERVEDLELGLLTYLGKGLWVLSLREPCGIPACFTSYYGPKKDDGKKEVEKKKKFKCSLQ
ncbi:cardiomyopathy-associated protein 5 [Megalops cyprinoides]|uniref:cardiomyopathy-associated protein 5 n=1 Tax=Megalops cyprinoides TaxID=118141 RepID=UPI001863A2FA|nr:cardiomyopathy-associated protein 5 [Megalops cyprinoides]